jgi:hypothetical protein
MVADAVLDSPPPMESVEQGDEGKDVGMRILDW